MIIRIGKFVFNPNEMPIMIQLTPEDKANIAAMPDDATSYCAFPKGMPKELIEKWMAREESELTRVTPHMNQQMQSMEWEELT